MASALSGETRARLDRVSVPTVVALLWRKNFRTTLLFGPRPVNPKMTKFVGTAFTVRTIPVREDLVSKRRDAASVPTCKPRR